MDDDARRDRPGASFDSQIYHQTSTCLKIVFFKLFQFFTESLNEGGRKPRRPPPRQRTGLILLYKMYS
jgi:hypothetical protein